MNFKIKDKDFLNEVMESNRIILEMKLLGNPFFYEPLRTSKDEVLGRSGLQKMLDEDYYRLHLLKKQKPLILDIFITQRILIRNSLKEIQKQSK